MAMQRSTSSLSAGTKTLAAHLPNPLAADVRSYDAALLTISRHGSLPQLLSFFARMLKSHHPPHSFTYNNLINACCRRALVARAGRLLAAMRSAGLTPGTYTYNSLILGFRRKKHLTAACGVFEQMPLKGLRCDVFSYNILMQGLCAARRVADACMLFDEMVKCQCVPDVYTYSILVDGLCKDGRVQLAKVLVSTGCGHLQYFDRWALQVREGG